MNRERSARLFRRKRLPIALVALWLLAGLAAPGLEAQTAFPSLDWDPTALKLSRAAGAYTWQELAEIALWASGAEQSPPRRSGAQNPSYMEIIASAAVELAASPALPANQRGRAEYVLTFMYERFLRNYSALQTRLDEVFVSGRYNCVSSAVFYTILASSIGLEVQGVMTRDHAFVTVNTGGELIDVETTNPYGFNPGSRREFQDAFGAVTGFAYVPARNYRDRVNISPLELVSLILSNRITELETRGRYG